MTQENGLMVDYDKKYQGRSSAEGSNKSVYTPISVSLVIALIHYILWHLCCFQT